MRTNTESTFQGKTFRLAKGLPPRETDDSRNKLEVGDMVLVCSHSMYGSQTIREVLELTEDNTGIKVLGVKLGNGQYACLYNVTCYKCPPEMVKLHPKLIGKN